MLISTVILFAVTMVSLANNNDRFEIKSIEFQGNEALSDDQLKSVMISVPAQIFRSSYYYPEVLKDDLVNLELFYHENGYLDAKVVTQTVTLDSTLHEARINVKIDEGQVTLVEAIDFFGNAVFSDDELRKMVNIIPGEPLKQMKIKQANLNVLTQYANLGYLESVIVPKTYIKPEINRVIIDFYITEHHKFKISDIRAVGLQVTHRIIIFRELTFKQGEIINYSKLLESQRKLYLLGLFKRVNINTVDSDDGDSTYKDIEIHVEEKKSGGFEISAGYESVEKLRGRVEFYNTNLWGTARKFSMSAKASFVNDMVEFSYTDPYTFRTDWRTDFRVGIEYAEEPGFDFDRTGAKVTLGRSFEEQTSAKLTYRKDKVTLKNVRVSEIPDDKKTDINSLKFSLTRDTRNNLFNATKGYFIEMSHELAGGFLSGTNSFYRIEGKIKQFYSFSQNIVVGSSFKIGYIIPINGYTKIPLNERLYAGGLNSVRGFDYKKLGSLDENRIPIGGRFSIVWNVLETRIPLYKMIGCAFFLDTGNVWESSREFRFNEMRASTGFGLRANTPIGLVRLDLGLNIDPRLGESSYKLHFGMGQAF